MNLLFTLLEINDPIRTFETVASTVHCTNTSYRIPP